MPTRNPDRGVFEKEQGSGVFWIRYHDAAGRLHRQVAGTRSQARYLYREKKREVRAIRHRAFLAGILPIGARLVPESFLDSSATLTRRARGAALFQSPDEPESVLPRPVDLERGGRRPTLVR